MTDAEAMAQLARWLRADTFRWQCLQTVRDILPVQAWLAAGFIRNLVLGSPARLSAANPIARH